jgi:hypothetical protein
MEARAYGVTREHLEQVRLTAVDGKLRRGSLAKADKTYRSAAHHETSVNVHDFQGTMF